MNDTTDESSNNEPMFSEDEVAAGAAAVRKKIDESGYGSYVTEDQCLELAYAVFDAVKQLRNQQ